MKDPPKHVFTKYRKCGSSKWVSWESLCSMVTGGNTLYDYLSGLQDMAISCILGTLNST